MLLRWELQVQSARNSHLNNINMTGRRIFDVLYNYCILPSRDKLNIWCIR